MLLCRRGLRYQRTMTRQEIRRPGWLLVVSLVYCSASCCLALPFENKTGPDEINGPRVFSPRMDYDEWTPLGRGDPLKNDPTFDYVPPILDRVQYWMDSHTTEASSKSDILVLGVTAKKTSPKIPEQFLKFVNGPKFMRNQEALGGYVSDFTGSRGAELPKVIRKTNFRNGVKDYRNQDRLETKPASYYPNSYYNQNSKPETMMLPPPIIRNPDVSRPHQKHRYSTQTEAGPLLQLKHQIYDRPQNSYSLPDAPPQPKPPRKHHPQIISDRLKPTTKDTSLSHIETIKSYTPSAKLPATLYPIHESTTPSVYSEKSNLIYQSSQTISSEWLAKTRHPTQSPSVDHEPITWRTGPSSDNRQYLYDDDVHQASGSSHHEVVLGPNANIIVEGDNGKEDIVIGQKEIILPEAPPSDQTVRKDKDEASPVPEENSENMFIVLANSSPSSETTLDHSKEDTPVTVVMPVKSDEKNVSDTTEPNEKLSQNVSTPLDSRLVAETEKPEEKPMPHHSFVNALTNPQSMMVYMNDVPGQLHSPTRIVMPYQPVPSRHAPHREFAEPPPQRVLAAHRQPSHARPAHGVTHHSPLLGIGNNFRETAPPPPPPPPPHLRPVMSQAEANTRFAQMQPFKTMTMPQGMINAHHHHQHSQPHRHLHQHQFGPSVPTTVTANAAPRPLTSLPINSIREVLLKDEAHRNVQRMPEIVETTTSTPLEIETHFEEDETKENIAATTESSTTVATPTSTWAAPTTTAGALTTDPIFSHYKQPANPMRGPMYLIIQGHSKVKTYKPWVDKHGNQVEKSEDVESTTSKGISEFEKFVQENTRKIAEAERMREASTSTERAKEQSARQDSLLSFVDSGFGAFPVTLSRRDHDDKDSNSLAITERPV